MPPLLALPRPVQAVVFDMDGLLFDTEALYRDATLAVAADAGHDIPLAFILTTIGLPGDVTRQMFGERYGPGFDFELFWTQVTRRFYQLAETELRLKSGVLELLDTLDAIPLPRAIATSSRHETAQHHLAVHGLRDRFPIIIARGDYLRGKPNPDPFLKAAERLGAAPESCLALEDSHNGVRAASSAGMMTIMVPDLLPVTPEMEKLCFFIATDLHQVRALFVP